jgi:hypothetical protein
MSFVIAAVGGMNAMQQVQAGKYAKGQAYLQAQQADYQAGIEQQTALQTAGLIRKAGARQVSAANAGYAAAGVKVGAGSALETERYIDQGSEHDAFQALLTGDRRASGLRTQATMDRIGGDAAERGGYVSAVGTLLSSGANAMRAGGWRTAGPGFSGGQTPAPVETRYVPRG